MGRRQRKRKGVLEAASFDTARKDVGVVGLEVGLLNRGERRPAPPISNITTSWRRSLLQW